MEIPRKTPRGSVSAVVASRLWCLLACGTYADVSDYDTYMVMTVDAAGFAYVVGFISSADFTTPAAHGKLPRSIPESAFCANGAGYWVSAFSMAATTCGESGVTSGSKRATIFPLRSTRNLVKFHLISPPVFGCNEESVRYW